MSGSPFNFSAFVNQYNIWEIDKNELEGIECIESFMSGFPDGTRPEDPDLVKEYIIKLMIIVLN